MTDSKIDPEQLAALLDGKLTGAARDEVIAQLARSEEAYEVFVDADGIVRELADQDKPSRAPARRASRVRPSWRWWRDGGTRFIALAAGVAGVAALSWVWSQRSAGGDASGRWPVALLSDGSAGLPTNWNDVDWPKTRARTEALTAETRAARIGARLVDLEMALRTRDQRAAGFAEELALLLDGVPGGAGGALSYRELARRGTAPAPEDWSETRASTEVLAGQVPARLGAWAEAGRIAALRHDAAFFSSDASRLLLRRAAEAANAKAPADSVLSRVTRSSIEETGDPPNWDARLVHLTLLVRVLGS